MIKPKPSVLEAFIGRRRLLRLSLLATAAPVAYSITACGGSRATPAGVAEDGPTGAPEAQPTPAPPPPPPPPFVLPAGREQRTLMAGTPYETPLYILGSGRPGTIVMALGGVHGNEPGGWLAAERIVDQVTPDAGALIVVPRANKLAVGLFERTTPELGDLNRLYPGNPDGLPMARMASEIVATIRELRVDAVVDMHESWAFYKDRLVNGTAYLGQTIATNPVEPGVSFVRGIVGAVNPRVLHPWEEFSFREFPPGRLPEPQSARPNDTSGNPEAAVSGGSSSSLGLPRVFPNLIAILVEMGQQQALERRIALHVDVLTEVLRQKGILSA